jgi:glycosyltransferase involved in cell wall biosynthesis
MIESLACGTPVIAWNCGSVPEVLEDGVTGVVVDSVDGAVDAVTTAASLDRGRIRQEFERRFSATTMAGRYLEIYQSLLDEERNETLRLEVV